MVTFNGNEVLRGYKEATTDLWTLPLGGDQRTPAQHDVVMPLVACPKIATARTWSPPAADGPTHVATFAHTVRTKANSIKYAHQSFCSPRLSTFLKAIRRGFLKGRPNLTSTGVTNYLNLSPASSKGHMKWPHQGICSTQPPPQPTSAARSKGAPPDITGCAKQSTPSIFWGRRLIHHQLLCLRTEQSPTPQCQHHRGQ